MNSMVTSVSCSCQINLSLCRGWLFNIVLGLKLHQVRFMPSEKQKKRRLRGLWRALISLIWIHLKLLMRNYIIGSEIYFWMQISSPHQQTQCNHFFTVISAKDSSVSVCGNKEDANFSDSQKETGACVKFVWSDEKWCQVKALLLFREKH